jgi:tetratricopeptide (TPR) repeat protein
MDISKQYDKAREAVERGNDDYAIKLLQELLLIRPDSLESRQLLRETVRKKFRKSGVKSAGYSAYLKGIVPLAKTVAFCQMKKHDQALIECEKFLVNDPDNRFALTFLGKSASQVPNCTDTAIWIFKSIVEDNPEDVKALQTLGELYEGMDNVLDAIDCYEEIIKRKPTDRATELKLRDLAARKTMKAGWDKVGKRGDFKQVVRDTDQMEDRSGEEEVIRTDADLERNLERVKKDLEEEPDNKGYVIQLGDLYRRGKRYDEAEAEYKRAKQLDVNDFLIDERLGDLRIETFNSKIEQIDDAVRKGTADAAAPQRLKELTAERDAFSTEEFRNRVEIRPTDLPLRYKLGVMLFNSGDIDGALAEFQQASKFPRHRRSALTYCGLCLYKKDMFDMAVEMFEQSLEGTITIGRDEKSILYNLGLAAEKLGDLAKAEESYKKIFNTDISFRDVKDKIEAIYKKRQAQKGTEPEAAT